MGHIHQANAMPPPSRPTGLAFKTPCGEFLTKTAGATVVAAICRKKCGLMAVPNAFRVRAVIWT